MLAKSVEKRLVSRPPTLDMIAPRMMTSRAEVDSGAVFAEDATTALVAMTEARQACYDRICHEVSGRLTSSEVAKLQLENAWEERDQALREARQAQQLAARLQRILAENKTLVRSVEQAKHEQAEQAEVLAKVMQERDDLRRQLEAQQAKCRGLAEQLERNVTVPKTPKRRASPRQPKLPRVAQLATQKAVPNTADNGKDP